MKKIIITTVILIANISLAFSQGEKPYFIESRTDSVSRVIEGKEYTIKYVIKKYDVGKYVTLGDEKPDHLNPSFCLWTVSVPTQNYEAILKMGAIEFSDIRDNDGSRRGQTADDLTVSWYADPSIIDDDEFEIASFKNCLLYYKTRLLTDEELAGTSKTDLAENQKISLFNPNGNNNDTNSVDSIKICSIKLKDYYSDYACGYYIGEITNGMANGYGTLTAYNVQECDKYVYEGNFVNNKRQGQGTMTIYYPKDDARPAGGVGKYVGEWMNDKRHGQGTYKYINDDGDLISYIGEWKYDTEDGYGTAENNFFGDSKYVGQFKNGKRDGYGTMYYKGIIHEKGEYRNDILYNGQEYNSDGTPSIGKIVNGRWVAP